MNVVFSGHTHVAAVPKPYKCGGGDGGVARKIQQVVFLGRKKDIFFKTANDSTRKVFCMRVRLHMS